MSAGSQRAMKLKHKLAALPARPPGSMCLGKLRYDRHSSAQVASDKMKGYSRVYPCFVCKGYHTTSKEKRK